MNISGIPEERLRAAAQLPENAHAKALDPWRKVMEVPLCDCELRNRRWNPRTCRCETCGRTYPHAKSRSETHEKAGGAVSSRRQGSTKRRGVPNRLESQFEREVLVVEWKTRWDAWQLATWQCEGITLRVPDVGAITPDWAAWDHSGRLVLFEVKGTRIHESTVLRTRAFAKAYPQVRFLIYCRRDKRWHLYYDSRRNDAPQGS